MDKSSVFERHKPFQMAEKLWKVMTEVGVQKCADLMKMLKNVGILFVQPGDNPLYLSGRKFDDVLRRGS